VDGEVQGRPAILASIGNGLLSASSPGLNACRGVLIPMPPGYDYDHDPGQAGQARSHGLRCLSRLTWRATQLSALATVGFAVLFARTAPAATMSGHRAPAPGPRPASGWTASRTHIR